MKVFKKLLVMLLVALMLCQAAFPMASAESATIDETEQAQAGSGVPVTAQGKFIDVPNGLFYSEAVYVMYELGVTAGTSTNTFSPNKSLDRGQVVTFLWRMAGSPVNQTWKNKFTDVKSSDWDYKAIVWAQNAKVTDGVSPTKFAPRKYVSVEEAYTFLARFADAHRRNNAGWRDAYDKGKVNGKVVNLHSYYDYSKYVTYSPEGYQKTCTISDWAAKSIIALTVFEPYFYDNKVPSGIVLGPAQPNQDPSAPPDVAGAKWGPQGPCSRGNFVYLLYRIFKDELYNQSARNYNYYTVKGSINITCAALSQGGKKYKYKLTYTPNLSFKTRDNKDWSYLGEKMQAKSQYNAHVRYTNNQGKTIYLCGIPSATNLNALTTPITKTIKNFKAFTYTSDTYTYTNGVPARVSAYWTVSFGTSMSSNIFSASVSYNHLWYGNRVY